MNAGRYIPLNNSVLSVQRFIPPTTSSINTISNSIGSCSSVINSYSNANSMYSGQKAIDSKPIPTAPSIGELLSKGVDFKTILDALT